jgi:hypothetical protein
MSWNISNIRFGPVTFKKSEMQRGRNQPESSEFRDSRNEDEAFEAAYCRVVVLIKICACAIKNP